MVVFPLSCWFLAGFPGHFPSETFPGFRVTEKTNGPQTSLEYPGKNRTIPKPDFSGDFGVGFPYCWTTIWVDQTTEVSRYNLANFAYFAGWSKYIDWVPKSEYFSHDGSMAWFYIILLIHEWLILMVNVGKDISPMDAMGKDQKIDSS